MGTVSQAATTLGLEWNQGDAVNLTWTVAGADWSGTYTGAVIVRGTGVEVPLTIADTYSAPDTGFAVTLSAADSDDVPKGEHTWYATSGDLTRFAGKVNVL